MAKGSPQFVLKPMILHKWVPILLGFLVGFPGKKNPRKTTEGVSSSHQVSPSSFSQSKEVQKWCEGFHKSTMEISKSFGRPFFCGSNLPDFHKKTIFDDFGPDFGVFQFRCLRSNDEFQVFGFSHGTWSWHPSPRRFGVGVWRFDAT